MPPAAWYWALALGASDLMHAQPHLHPALHGRDAMHVVAHVLFQHALALPGTLARAFYMQYMTITTDVEPLHMLPCMTAPPMGPASARPPAPRLVPLLCTQLRALAPGDPATAHAHEMLHTVVRAGMLQLWTHHRHLVGSGAAATAPIAALYSQAFVAVVTVLQSLFDAMHDAAQQPVEVGLANAHRWCNVWCTPAPPIPRVPCKRRGRQYHQRRCPSLKAFKALLRPMCCCRDTCSWTGPTAGPTGRPGQRAWRTPSWPWLQTPSSH